MRGQKVLGHFRGASNKLVGGYLRMQALGDRKTFAGQFDCWLEQVTPRQFAMLLMGHFQRPEHPGHADRTPTYLGVRERYRLAIRPHKHGRGGTCRSGFTTIEGLHPLAVPIHNESATADAAGLWLDQCQNRLHGDRRINGRAAFAQHLLPGLSGQRVGRRSHMPGRIDRGHIGAQTRGYFGRRRQLGGFLKPWLHGAASGRPQGQS